MPSPELQRIHDKTACFGLDDDCCARAFAELRKNDPELAAIIERVLGSDPWTRVPVERRALLALLVLAMTDEKRERGVALLRSALAKEAEAIWRAGVRCRAEHRDSRER